MQDRSETRRPNLVLLYLPFLTNLFAHNVFCHLIEELVIRDTTILIKINGVSQLLINLPKNTVVWNYQLMGENDLF